MSQQELLLQEPERSTKDEILDSLCLKGRLYSQQGRTRKAIAVWKQVITLDGQNFLGHYHMGVNYMRLGKRQKAHKMFQLAYQIKPEDHDVQNALKMFDPVLPEPKVAASEPPSLLSTPGPKRDSTLWLNRVLTVAVSALVATCVFLYIQISQLQRESVDIKHELRLSQVEYEQRMRLDVERMFLGIKQDYEQKIASLEQEVRLKNEENRRLASQVRELQLTVHKLQEQLNGRTVENQQLKQSLNTQASRLVGLRNQQKKQQTGGQQTNQENVTLKEQLEQLNLRNQRLEEQLIKAQRVIVRLKEGGSSNE